MCVASALPPYLLSSVVLKSPASTGLLPHTALWMHDQGLSRKFADLTHRKSAGTASYVLHVYCYVNNDPHHSSFPQRWIKPIRKIPLTLFIHNGAMNGLKMSMSTSVTLLWFTGVVSGQLFKRKIFKVTADETIFTYFTSHMPCHSPLFFAMHLILTSLFILPQLEELEACFLFLWVCQVYEAICRNNAIYLHFRFTENARRVFVCAIFARVVLLCTTAHTVPVSVYLEYAWVNPHLLCP